MLPSFCVSNKCSLSTLAPLEAILFDIDGTLCHSDPHHYFAFRGMLQEVQLFFNAADNFHVLYLVIPIDIGEFNRWVSMVGSPSLRSSFFENISGKHNEGICGILFPNWDLKKSLKFMDDKEAMFRR